jgi:uncharacterized membrane protein required for colicin V production
MNGLTIAALFIILAAMIYGYFRGFVRVVFSLVSMVLMIVLISWGTPYVAALIKDHTGLHANIQESAADNMRGRVQGPEDAAAETGMPALIQNQIASNMGQAIENSGVYDAVGAYTANWVVSGIAFFITLALAGILLRFVVGFLDLFTKIPIISGINRICGMAIGLVLGLVFVYLLLFLAVIISPSHMGQQMIASIEESMLLRFLYNNNGILYLLNGSVSTI